MFGVKHAVFNCTKLANTGPCVVEIARWGALSRYQKDIKLFHSATTLTCIFAVKFMARYMLVSSGIITVVTAAM